MVERRERLLILGAGVMQGPAINIAKELGLETVVVDADPRAPWVSMADRFEQVDLKDKAGIEALGHALKTAGGLAGIMTAGTDFSATVAWTAERLGLPGIPYEASLNASDKERMRRCFKAAGVPSPEFIVLTSAEDMRVPLPYPLVVKPVDNMGARGCRRVDTSEGLPPAVLDALRFSRSGRVIVEAYMEGPEFSVDAIVYKGEVIICGLADRHIFFPPYFIEMGHTMPTMVDAETAGALLATFIQGIKALGLATDTAVGAAKGDIKLTPSGPMIGEIAARLSGGYMSGWTYPYSSGVEPTRGAILVALGKVPEGLSPTRSWTSAERAFISIPGTVRSIHGTEKAKAIEYVQDLFLRIEPGSRVRFPENNVTKCGNIISAAPSRALAVDAAEQAARSILIRLEASDDETEQFLTPLSSFLTPPYPPDAFTLPGNLQDLLAALPESEDAPGQDLPMLPGLNGEVLLLPFPEFTGSGLTDYTGRTVAASIEAVRLVTGLPLPLAEEAGTTGVKTGDQKDGTLILGHRFWAALIRGGYQGAAYFVERVVQKKGRCEKRGIRSEE
ncbi:MAG: ATP-grasp domain-containing protein [Treponema sp.]|nr:ATP-grasp domain-containing protein [Treponema sp.]